MKKAYFDCFAGASGDMIIGAFLDAGFDFFVLEQELSKIDLHGFSLHHSKIMKNGISSSKFDVEVLHDHHHRPLSSIIGIINNSGLHPEVKKNAISIFSIIGTAEAKIHNTGIENIHFHEIGGVDSIIDICGAAICFHISGITEAASSPLNTGSGFTSTAHGKLPVPAPATAEILRGIPSYSSGIESELTTPTGAAIIKHYCSAFTSMPEIKADTIGYGAGTKDLEIPNVLRLFISEEDSSYALDDEVAEIETSIDDMNPEFYSYLMEKLINSGALDVSIIPVIMKKNRPGHILKVLTVKQDTDMISAIIFGETTTSGLRINIVRRKILERSFVTVSTEYGPVRLKVHRSKGNTVTVSPEYEDCRKAAVEKNVPLKQVYASAIEKFKTGN